MHLLHRNVTGLRANLDLAQTVAANKVQNHLTDNQNLLKEVNNLRFEVRNLSMENQRLMAQLEFNNRMNAGKKKPGLDGPDSASELLFPQYHTHNGRQASNGGPLFENRDVSASIDSFHAIPSESDRGSAVAGEGPSYDSNNLRDADYFNRMRSGIAVPDFSETAPVLPTGPRGFTKKVAKSSSTPTFKVHAMHSDPVAEGARMALDAGGGGAQQQASVASKRTISGVPSYASSFELPEGGGGSGVMVNKNEFSRSADDKIAALIELNEQQIRMYKEEVNKSQSSLGQSKPKGQAKVAVGGPAVRGERSLELLGAPAVVVDAGAVQLPSIRKGSSSSGQSKKK